MLVNILPNKDKINFILSTLGIQRNVEKDKKYLYILGNIVYFDNIVLTIEKDKIMLLVLYLYYDLIKSTR